MGSLCKGEPRGGPIAEGVAGEATKIYRTKAIPAITPRMKLWGNVTPAILVLAS